MTPHTNICRNTASLYASGQSNVDAFSQEGKQAQLKVHMLSPWTFNICTVGNTVELCTSLALYTLSHYQQQQL